jgi:hypothetical protein
VSKNSKTRESKYGGYPFKHFKAGGSAKETYCDGAGTDPFHPAHTRNQTVNGTIQSRNIFFDLGNVVLNSQNCNVLFNL